MSARPQDEQSGARLARVATPRRDGDSPGRERAVPETVPVVTVPPRLLDLAAAGAYLGGCSPWTVRDLIAAGVLRRVRIPLPNGGELRKVLLDREDLDRLVVAWKDRA